MEIELKPRTEAIGQLIQDHIDGKIPFSGEGSLYQRVWAMGYSCTNLYEMVIAAEAAKPAH